MRVGLSFLTLVPGISGGSEVYARELARALGRVGRHSYRALVPTLALDAADGLTTTVADGYRATRSTPGRLLAMGAAALRPGPLHAGLEGVDIVHYPLTVPVPRDRRPTVVTLLDTQHLDLPMLFSRGERAFRRLAYDRTARRADRVVVISEWVRGRAVERLGLDPKRVRTIHLAVDHQRFTPAAHPRREPFLLYPARPWPHKNHARLFDAFAVLRARHPELRLVLTGQGHDQQLLPPGVEARGSVGVEELVELYRTAAALVFPSLYEGFGLPPLEAMACGCPVAASNAGSLPEVCGAAASLFDPYDVESIIAGVDTALGRAAELSALGLTRAAGFTWDETARAHDDVYAEAAGG
jgi:glycosyltransferase involved in cell wall biosynthesis